MYHSMAGLDWAVVLLVVYPLIQVPLVFYLGRRFELDGDPPVTQAMSYWPGQPSTVGTAAQQPPRPGRCRYCGADNDPSYRFCGTCVARLQ